MVSLRTGETKNKKPRKIPLAPDVLEALRFQRARRDQYFPKCPFVFFRHATGERILGFRQAWKTACQRCGLWDEATKKPTKQMHDCRRSAVRNLVRSGVSEQVAMKISGHLTPGIFKRYDITAETDLFDAAAKLDRYEKAKREAAAARAEAAKAVPAASIQ
jgi:integrase